MLVSVQIVDLGVLKVQTSVPRHLPSIMFPYGSQKAEEMSVQHTDWPTSSPPREQGWLKLRQGSESGGTIFGRATMNPIVLIVMMSLKIIFCRDVEALFEPQ